MLPAVKIKLLVLGFIASAVVLFIVAPMSIIAKRAAGRRLMPILLKVIRWVGFQKGMCKGCSVVSVSRNCFDAGFIAGNDFALLLFD